MVDADNEGLFELCVVGVAIGYGLDGPGIESRGGWGKIFRKRPDRPCGPPSLLYSGHWVSHPLDKAARA